MNQLIVHGVERPSDRKFLYSYTIEGDWAYYFRPENPMWVEYDHSVSEVSDSVAVIPLVGNFIVLASLLDAVICVDEIDEDFYNCVEEFMAGFDHIMPDSIHFKQKDLIQAKKIVKNPLREGELQEDLLFFSGGVDATSSLISHLEDKPALVSIWGADVPWDNEEAWNIARGLNQQTADRFGLNFLTIRSNFRRAYEDDHVNDYSREISDDWWWSAFHHSVAMMCLAAPIASGKRRNLYFGSTYSAKDLPEWGTYVTASDPQVDDHVRFCGCRVIHDGYELSRYDKIRNICHFFQERREEYLLRVCYLSNTGKNCGHCEKCASTAMGIRLAGGNPADFGIPVSDEDLPRFFAAGMQEMGREEKYAFMSFYNDIHKEYVRQHTLDQVPPVLRLFYRSDLSEYADSLFVPCNEVIELSNNTRQREKAIYEKFGQDCAQLRQESAQLRKDSEHLQQEKLAAEKEMQTLREELAQLKNSTSWKITAPVRKITSLLKGKKD